MPRRGAASRPRRSPTDGRCGRICAAAAGFVLPSGACRSLATSHRSRSPSPRSAAVPRPSPNPKDAVAAYAEAAARGDADAIYEMMTTSAQKSRSREDVRRLVKEQRGELAEQAKLVTARDARVEATRAPPLRGRRGGVSSSSATGASGSPSSGALPGGSRTPEQALDQLRRVLARRSYAGLMRVLTPATRSAIEQDLRSLVVGARAPRDACTSR